MLRRLLPLLVLASASALPSMPTHAANGLRPRTPAQFQSVPCLQAFDRGEPVDITYAVPFDDVTLTPDELPDSRKHQFFAFGQTHWNFAFPVWINQGDFDRAEANGDITVDFGPDDILESSSQWPTETWVRITPDDPRLPITLEQAAMGVTWDTTDVAPGTWVVAAYTWEPENNLWSPRFGAVRIEDPADREAGGPTVFLPREDGLIANRGEPLAVTGCVEAPEGSTVTASWGTIVGVDEPQWVPFLEDEPVDSGELTLDLVAPAEAGATIKLRVEITDPQGRTYVAYTPTTIAVVGEVMETGGDDDGGGEGCGCASDRPSGSAGPLGLLVLLGLLRRRRRR